jgi:histidinol-phosphate phosphatase family protein
MSEGKGLLNRAVFLDRDGTINEEVGYLRRLDQLKVFPGAAAAIRALNRAGIKVVVVTNQSGVARGYFAEDFINEVHGLLQEQLDREGAWIDAFYHCPHHPTEGQPPYRRECNCRKPAPGLLRRASRDLQIDLDRSYMIGDTLKDIQAGKAVGAKSILVKTGYGAEEKIEGAFLPDHIAPDLQGAVNWILGDLDS